MKKAVSIVMLVFSCSVSFSQDLGKLISTATNVINGNNSSTPTLSNEQVVGGLKEALTIGTNNSTAFASKLDGFYKNPSIFIPFPPEAQMVKDYATKVGMKAKVDKFETTLNRAAEEAAKNAAPVFINAIKSMTISDGFTILKGSDNAATQYLKDKTTAELTQKFTPIVQAAIDKVELTKYWNPLVKKYNKIPFVQKQNPDLTAYVTERALAGLFKLLADEELKIRKDPAAQVTNLLKQVFGSLLK